MQVPRIVILTMIAALGLHPGAALAQDKPKEKTIGVFVALADPKHTGIEPLPPSIGDGDNAETNLYWGNDEGLKGTFDHSKKWKLVDKNETPQAEVVMSTRTYRRVRADGASILLVARAYRGSQMRRCIEDYEGAIAHGSYDLVVFIGHDGLMDFQLPSPEKAAGQARTPDCIALCCVSETYFKDRIIAAGGRPVLLTTQLMYPGSFTLEALADTWASGGTPATIRESAATAYARNQKISKKAALGVFADLKSE